MALERHVSGQSQFGPGQEETPAIVGGIRELLGDSLLAIVMFGSVARGDSRDGSDIDLLIALNRGRALKRNIYSLWDERFPAQEHNPHFVHLPLQTLDAGSLWLEAAVDGVVQYDRDGTVSRFLGRVRRLIASGKLKRRFAYGHPYWLKAGGDHENVQ